MTSLMRQVTRPTPSHFGIYCMDLERMAQFYVRVFDLTITDQGQPAHFRHDLVFLSASKDQHHQLVLASGRPADAVFSNVMQISFMVPSIQYLRDIWTNAQSLGATNIRGINHGNSLSVYFSDPENNTVEIYIDMPFHVTQPHGTPLDLSQGDAVSSLIITAAVQGNLPDLSTDFMPVAITHVLPFVLVVPAELPAKTVQEFIALARAKPGQLNFAATNGTFPHLAFELVKSISKTDIVHVPFKSANDMAIALAAAQVQGMIIPYGSIAGVHQAGRVRVLAVTTAQRSRVLPDVPTLAESGLPGYNLAGWNGFLAPIGTPPEVVRKLNAAVRQGQKEPEIERQLAATGNEPGPDFTPEQFGDFLKAEVAKWNKLARDAAVRIN